MTKNADGLMVQKYALVLHRILVEIRNLTFNSDCVKRVHELAEIAHNVPLFLIGLDDFVAEHLRAELASYEAKHGSKGYTQILNMEESEFDSHYGRTHWEWPEPVEAEAKM